MQSFTGLLPQCANCQITIHWLPIIVDGQSYCCFGCAEGGPCTCDYGHLPEASERSAMVLHHSPYITFIEQTEKQED